MGSPPALRVGLEWLWTGIMVNETWKRRRRERGRARRYDPMAEPVQLPEGFIGKIRGALQVAVSDLRECVSWLDREIGTPMLEVGVTLHLNREYGKPGEPDADDIVATVWFDDPYGGRNCQRFTWVYSDQRMKDEGGQEGMKDEGGRMKKRKGRVALAAEAARLEDVGAMGSAVPTLEPCSADVQVVPDADLRPVEVATEPVLVPVAESAGLECLSVAAELAVDECGLDELEADVEVRREAGESEEPLGPEGTTERSDAQNPEADANRIAGENCALHDSDLCVPTVLAQMTRVESVPDAGLADFERAPRVAAGGWRAWRWAVAAALLFGALLGGWWLTGAARAVVSREVGGETVRVPVERVPFGVNVEAPFEPRSGP